MPLNLRWVLLLAFSLRSIIAGATYLTLRDPNAFYAKDTWSYLQPAIEWMTNGSFTAQGEPELFRTPGYAVLLSVGIKLGQIEFVTIALQILLSCATTYLVFRIAIELFANERTAIWSALAYCLEPLSIISCSWLLSETLFGVLLAAALLSLFTFVAHRKLKWLILSSLLFAAAAYVRPIGYYLPLVITFIFLLWSITKRDWSLLKPALLFCLISVALMSIWQFRNYRQTGFAGFSIAMSYNTYFHQVAALRASEQNRPFYEVMEEMGFYDREKYLQAHPEQRNWPLAERYEFMRREGLMATWRAPLLATKIYTRGLIIATFDPGAAEYLRLFQFYPRSGRLLNTMVNDGLFAVVKTIITQQPLLFGLTAILGLWLLGYYGLALIGLTRQTLTLPLLLLVTTGLYQLALAGGTLASARFRMPVMIVVCILAGHGLSKFQIRKN